MEAASTINAPHPSEAKDDTEAEDFFGTGVAEEEDPGPSEELTEEEAAVLETALSEQDDEPKPAEPRSGPTAEAKAAMDALKVEPEATAPPEPEATPEPEPEQNRQGSASREYVVFQKVALTEKVLKHLLAQIEKGEAPTPRVAYFELHRATTRNDRQAIADAYKANRDVLGETADLAAVSSRSFKERHVEPRQVVTDNLAIT